MTDKSFAMTSELLQLADTTLDLRNRCVTTPQRSVHLSPKEAALLALLMAHPGQTLMRHEIMERVWGYTDSYATLYVHMSWLRRKLQLARSSLRVRAIRGLGYRLERPV